MSEVERIITYHNDANMCEKSEMSIFGSKRGDLVLTNRRLVFIQTGWGIHIKAYDTVQDLEEAKNERGAYHEIDLFEVVEVASDSHMMSPYFTVKYETTHGITTRHFFVPAGTYFEPEKWVICIMEAGNEVKYDIMQEEIEEEKETGEFKRDKYIVNVTGTAFAGKIVNNLFIETLRSGRPELTDEDIILFDGGPKDEVYVAFKNYLPRAALITFFGLKIDKFSDEELNNIEEFVREGGRLVISSDAPWDPPAKLAEVFGIEFGSDRVQDLEHHEGKHNDHIIVTDLTDHPLNNDISFICFGDYGGHPLTIRDHNSETIARSSNKAEPPEATVASLINYHEGEILVIGQTCLFDGNFIDMEGFDNRRWFENIVQYMTRVEDEEIPEKAEKLVFKLSQKFCHNCGKELEDNFKFCGYCGAHKVELDLVHTSPEAETQTIQEF